jgi:meso-butanediol dehydrogenase/(S,S)-butanediol dehydrogenase/diacetyl reductase
MEISLNNRVALVTGAAQGIGEGIAMVLARAGADVIVVDIQAESGQATADAIAALGRRSLFVETDLADPNAVSAMMAQVTAEFGALDIVVNNAAVEYFTNMEETTLEQWDHTHHVGLRGLFLTIQSALPLLRQSENAAVFNIASVHATATIPDLGAYAAVKGGIVAITRSMAQDLGREGIRVVAVSPGFIFAGMTRAWLDSQEDRQATLDRVNEMHPSGRIGTPEDIGNFIAFASTELGSFINGVELVIDGGLTSMLHH